MSEQAKKKMNPNEKRKMNPVIKSVIVMACIMAISVAVLSVAHKYLYVDWGDIALNNLVEGEKKVVYDIDDNDLNGDLKAFNSAYGTSSIYVLKAWEISGGSHVGKFIIETTAVGYSNGYIKTLTAFHSDGTIYKIAIREYSSANSYSYKVDLNKLNSNLSGKKQGDVDSYDKTGATATMGGIIDGVNIASTFFDKVIVGTVEVKERVEVDTTKLAELQALFNIQHDIKYNGTTITSAYHYNITTVRKEYNELNFNNKNSPSAAVIGAYKAYDAQENEYVIVETQAYIGFGGWRLLILMDNDDNTVAAVKSTNKPFVVDEDYFNYDDTDFKNTWLLSTVFSQITGLDQILEYSALGGTTAATQSNKGLRAAVAVFFDKIDYVLEQMPEYEIQEGEDA